MLNEIVSLWEKLDEKVNEITLRERVLITLCCVVIIGGLTELFVFEEVRVESKKLKTKRDSFQKTQLELIKEQLNYRKTIKLPKEKAAQIEALDEQISKTEKQIAGLATGMLSPRAMTDALKSILEKRGSLRLVSLKNYPAEPAFSINDGKVDQDKAEKKEEDVLLYRHRLEIILRGSYPASEKFITLLEQSSLKLLWDKINYEIKEYPDGDLTISVFTLSREKDWIGV